MTAILQAILLGVIEGLTEFLPISSTGHLIVAEKVIGYKDAAELFTVVIQVGAIIAVVWHYREDLLQKVKGLLSGKKTTRQFWINWVIATLPAAVAGLLIAKKLDTLATLPVIAGTLILGGIIILLVENMHRSKASVGQPKFEQLTIKQAVQIGFYQIAALVPGVSRSGATIMGGLLSGLDRVTATAFSFYLSLPILVLASGYKLAKDGDQLSSISGGSTALIVGIVASFITAFMVIRWLLQYVAHHDFKLFAYYRITLGSLIFLALLIIR